jgi:hypothetical protein
MNFKQLVDSIATETSLPAAEVKKVSTAVLQKFVDLIETQGTFSSPLITVTTTTTPAKPAIDDRPARSERKIARMAIREKKAV